jgi:nucleotide-binding universal stress UspA family protein
MFQRILVPIDGSRNSIQAALHSFAFVKAFESRVTLLYIISPEMKESAEKAGTGSPMVMATEILDIAKRVLLRKKIPTKELILEGPPAPRICAAAVTERCDLIIMGSRGISNIPDFMMGSVSSKVSQFARSSVLVVRNPVPLKGILVAYDGSRLSQKALEVAGELAIRFKAVINLVTVAHEGEENEGLRLIKGANIIEWHLKMVNAGIDVRMDLRTGHAAETVVKMAADQRMNLVVIGGTGHTGNEEMGLGSVCDQVLRHCECSVLAVK